MNCATLYSGSTQSLVALMGSFSACELPLPFLGGNSKEAQTPWQTDALVEHSQARIKMAYAGHCDFLTGDFNAADESLYVESMKSCISNKCQKIKICHCAETLDRTCNFGCTYCSGTMCSHVNIDTCTHIHRDSSTKWKLSCLLTSLSSSYLSKRINLYINPYKDQFWLSLWPRNLGSDSLIRKLL